MQDQRPPVSLKRNVLVIAVILTAVAALLIISRLNATPGAPLPTLAPTAPGAEAAPSPDPAATPGNPSGAQAFLLVSVRGRLYAIEPLNEERDVEIAQETGETNVIHLTPNGFHMKSSTCDNQLCISQGEVTTENYSRRILGPYVLCLPNQVELQLVVPGATQPPDAPDI